MVMELSLLDELTTPLSTRIHVPLTGYSDFSLLLGSIYSLVDNRGKANKGRKSPKLFFLCCVPFGHEYKIFLTTVISNCLGRSNWI